MAGNEENHIKFEGYMKTDRYTSNQSGRDKFDTSQQNRNIHGNAIKDQLLELKTKFEDLAQIELPIGIVREDVVYAEFLSDIDFRLAFDSLDNTKNLFVLLNTKKISTVVNGVARDQYKAVVMLTMGG